MELKNTVVAITGGASGLGEASTRHFVAHGAKVMILDINDDNAKAICDELGVATSVQNKYDDIQRTCNCFGFLIFADVRKAP